MAGEVGLKHHQGTDVPVELLRTDYIVITQEASGRILRQRRSSLGFATPEAARATYGQAVAVYDRVGRTGRGLLVDSRLAPGRNDPDFEAVMSEFRRRALPGFAATAVLVQSAAGRLQAQRITRQDGTDQLVTSDEAAALAYLLLQAKGPPARRLP